MGRQRPAPRSGTRKANGASFVPISSNPKLSPVERVDVGVGDGRLRPVPRRPYVSVTYASIAATCSDRCAFKARGCYASAGFALRWLSPLDVAAADKSAEQVIAAEAALIDQSFRYQGCSGSAPGGRVPRDGGCDGRAGRDLRLHVAGDVGSERGARLLAGAAERWQARGGGAVWTFTHNWRDVPPDAFGPISVLASVENAGAAGLARERGYAVAIVVREFPSTRAFQLVGMADRVVPCPAETHGTTCVECRLCLDAPKLRARDIAIGFALHGRDAAKVRHRLPVVREVEPRAMV